MQTAVSFAAEPGKTTAREALPLDVPRILDESLAGGVLSQAAAARLKTAGALAGSASSNSIAQYSSRYACSMHSLTVTAGRPVGFQDVKALARNCEEVARIGVCSDSGM